MRKLNQREANTQVTKKKTAKLGPESEQSKNPGHEKAVSKKR